MKKEKRSIIIPLTFSKGLKLSIVEIQRHLIQKKWQYTTLSVLSVMLMTGGIFFYENYTAKGATYGWLQTDWSGGADITATSTHTTDQTGWTQYYSKTDNLSTASGELTQTSATPDAWIETEDADFNDYGTFTDSYTSGGVLYPKKSDGVTCLNSSECIGNFCNVTICDSNWTEGVTCSGFAVYNSDSSLNSKWKNVASTCVFPQCLGGSLVADNDVDFSAYPARQACKVVGGRLPTAAELGCLLVNAGDYIGTFSQNLYWSADSYDSGNAYYTNKSSGLSYYVGMEFSYGVRCVVSN